MAARTSLGFLVLGSALSAGACTVVELYVGSDRTASAGTSSTGTTSTGSTGTGGAPLCVPGMMQPCYDGPAGTEGVGICTGGTQTCAADGQGWGPCAGEVLPQPENCASGIDQNCDGVAPACTGTLSWAKTFGDQSDQRATAVAVDPSGDILVVGYFAGTIDFGCSGGPLASAGGTDAFVVKLDPSGVCTWAEGFGDQSDQQATAVAVDSSGNVLVAGNFAGAIDFGSNGGPLVSAGGTDVFVAKLDPSGGYVWANGYGDHTNQGATGVAVDTAENATIVGYYNGTIDFGGGPLVSTGGTNLFAVELSQSGGHVWSEGFGNSGLASATGVVVDGSNQLATAVLLTGYCSGAVDFGDAGTATAMFGSDAVVAKLAGNSGAAVWLDSAGATEVGASGSSVAVGRDGNVFAIGDFGGQISFGGSPLQASGSQDVWLLSVTSSGSYGWSKQFGMGGTFNSAFGIGVAVDPFGNVVVTGNFSGAVDLGGSALASTGTDVFLGKLDASGTHVWSQRFGALTSATPGVAWPGGVAADAAANVVIAGRFSGSIDFGNGPITSAGANDVFVAKFSP